MDTFRWITVTLAMLLGLGVTQLLSGAIAVFRSRAQARIDWVPLVWAAAIFVLQIQFWWAIIELAQLIDHWTLPHFLLLLGIPLLLFAAAALVLPPRELPSGADLAELFRRDGRWGLVCLSGYAGLALLVDHLLYASPWLSLGSALLLIEFALPVAFLLGPNRRTREALTVAYLLVVLFSSWTLSPKAY